MWQEIAIIIIALIVIIFIGRKLYNFLSHPPAANNPCCGCTGCALKAQNVDLQLFKNKRHPIRRSVESIAKIPIK